MLFHAGPALLFLALLLVTPGVAGAAVDQGKIVYEAQCVPCHGMAGEGGYGAKLATSHLVHARNKADIIRIVQRGLPGTNMPSFGLLAESEIVQVSGYVEKLGQVPETPLPGDAARGQALYASSGCAACHIRRGEGAGFGPELSEVGVRRSVEYLRKKLTEPGAQITEGFLSVRAITAEGAVIEGIRVSEDTFSVLIRDQSRRLYSLRKAELKTYERLEHTSRMPSYGSKLSQSQMDDLVSFLAKRDEL